MPRETDPGKPVRLAGDALQWYDAFVLSPHSEGPEDNHFDKLSECFCGLMGELQEISLKVLKKYTVECLNNHK